MEENYNYSVSQSVIMNIQGEFDQLIHNVVTTINQVLVDAANAAIKEGRSYMQNEDGSPIVLFEKIGDVSYKKQADGTWKESEPDESRNGYKGSLFSINNITINKDLVQVPTKLGFIKEDGSVDYETLEVMKIREGVLTSRDAGEEIFLLSKLD